MISIRFRAGPQCFFGPNAVTEMILAEQLQAEPSQLEPSELFVPEVAQIPFGFLRNLRHSFDYCKSATAIVSPYRYFLLGLFIVTAYCDLPF